MPYIIGPALADSAKAKATNLIRVISNLERIVQMNKTTASNDHAEKYWF